MITIHDQGKNNRILIRENYNVGQFELIVNSNNNDIVFAQQRRLGWRRQPNMSLVQNVGLRSTATQST